MLLDGVESGAEVDKETPDKVMWRVQVPKDEVQQAGHRVLCASCGLVGKLKGVKLWGCNWQDVIQQQPLQALHYYWCQGNRAIVVEFSDFLGTGIIVAVFQRVGMVAVW